MVKPTRTDYYLATLTPHGTVDKLIDGPHSKAFGAHQAAYLIKSLGLPSAGKPMAVARVQLFDVVPTSQGVNQDAVDTLNRIRS
jgi:hypothetical protein